MKIAEYAAGSIGKVEQAPRSTPMPFTPSNDELRLAGLIAENNRLSSWHMELADFINLGDRDPAMRFLVIGGYAVAAHGHTRATFDVDFLVRRAEREAWFARLSAAGLKLFGQSNAFAQFSQPGDGDGLDLMLVDESTFDRMWQASEEREFGGSRARIPCLDHLLALKLHALKQALPHRTSKDAEDVEVLARRNRLNLSDLRYEQLFLKYGNRELYDTFLRLLRTP